MKKILIVGMIVGSLAACNSNEAPESTDVGIDSSYAPQTDTGQALQPDSTGGNPSGAGMGSGSGSQASQDTGRGQ
jgi:hypothetical protein